MVVVRVVALYACGLLDPPQIIIGINAMHWSDCVWHQSVLRLSLFLEVSQKGAQEINTRLRGQQPCPYLTKNTKTKKKKNERCRRKRPTFSSWLLKR